MAASANPNADGHDHPDWADMQGLVLSSYPHLDQAAYLMFRIENPEELRSWLGRFHGRVTPALKRPETKNYQPAKRYPWNLNIAFTHWGLKKLGDEVSNFSDAFEHGHDTDTRPIRRRSSITRRRTARVCSATEATAIRRNGCGAARGEERRGPRSICSSSCSFTGTTPSRR